MGTRIVRRWPVSLVSSVIDVFFLMLMLFWCVYRLGPAVLATWTASVEAAFEFSQLPEGPLDTIHQALDLLTGLMLQELSPVTRRKCEHLITSNSVTLRGALSTSACSIPKGSLGCPRCDFIWIGLWKIRWRGCRLRLQMCHPHMVGVPCSAG